MKNFQEAGLKEAGFLLKNSQVTEVGALDLCSQDAYCQVTEVGALDLYSQDTYNDYWEAGFLLNNSQKVAYCWEIHVL